MIDALGWLAYAWLAAFAALLTLVLVAGAYAGAHEGSRDRYRTPRPMPRLDHDADVYSGAYGGVAEDIRRECLEVADNELRAAARRMEAAR